MKIEIQHRKNSPKERLIELQNLYNSMEYEMDTNLNRMKCNFYMDEINHIVKLYPELRNIIQLNFLLDFETISGK